MARTVVRAPTETVGVPTLGKVARGALKSDVVRGTLEDQLTQLVNQQFAKVRAMRYARETDSVAAQVQFADGPQRWVIFRDGVPIASFPGYDDELEEAASVPQLRAAQDEGSA